MFTLEIFSNLTRKTKDKFMFVFGMAVRHYNVQSPWICSTPLSSPDADNCMYLVAEVGDFDSDFEDYVDYITKLKLMPKEALGHETEIANLHKSLRFYHTVIRLLFTLLHSHCYCF
jgi:hypothetical protein